MNAFEPGGTNYLKYVQQAYVSVLAPVGKGGLTVDFGKFVTPAGAEVIENKDNFNYSRGLLFALAIPYYHMGARIGYSFSDKVSLTGYLVNGWNDVKDNNNDKTVGASLAIKPGKATIIANYLVGNEQPEGSDGGTRNLIDLVATLPLGEKSSFLINYDYGHDKVAGDGVNWSGIALGLKFQLSSVFAISPRYEYFADSDGFATGTDQNLQEFTLTGEWKMPSGLLARAEFRNDFSDKHFFAKDSGAFSKNAAVGFVLLDLRVLDQAVTSRRGRRREPSGGPSDRLARLFLSVPARRWQGGSPYAVRTCAASPRASTTAA